MIVTIAFASRSPSVNRHLEAATGLVDSRHRMPHPCRRYDDMNATIALPAISPSKRALIIALLLGLGLWSFVAVQPIRIDCHNTDRYLMSDTGSYITTELGMWITTDSKRECRLVIGNAWIFWPAWGTGIY
jgi:hypothetical protein